MIIVDSVVAVEKRGKTLENLEKTRFRRGTNYSLQGYFIGNISYKNITLIFIFDIIDIFYLNILLTILFQSSLPSRCLINTKYITTFPEINKYNFHLHNIFETSFISKNVDSI